MLCMGPCFDKESVTVPIRFRIFMINIVLESGLKVTVWDLDNDIHAMAEVSRLNDYSYIHSRVQLDGFL